MKNEKIIFIIFFAVSFVFPSRSVLADLSSSLYTIYAPTVTFEGGRLNSENYTIEELSGESAAGIIESQQYRLKLGSVYITIPFVMKFSVSKSNIDLGTLSPSQVASDNIVLSITTNAKSGYAVMIFEDGNLRTEQGNDIDDVVVSPVEAGAEEYGISTTGADGALSQDMGITNGLIVAASSGAARESQVTVTFKSAVSAETAAGDYRHIVTFIASGTF